MTKLAPSPPPLPLVLLLLLPLLPRLKLRRGRPVSNTPRADGADGNGNDGDDDDDNQDKKWRCSLATNDIGASVTAAIAALLRPLPLPWLSPPSATRGVSSEVAHDERRRRWAEEGEEGEEERWE